HAVAARRQAAAQGQGGGGLAHAALLVGDRPHAHQSDPPVILQSAAPAGAVAAAAGPSATPFAIGRGASLLTAMPSAGGSPDSVPGAPGAASTISTTRRLRLRPSSVRLSARGRCSP